MGYADTVGFDTDANGVITSEGKWKYRDYVIRAFNTDKPYDRFVTEQLAGDELVDWRHAPRFNDQIREDLIATGYLRTANDNSHEPESNIPLIYYGVLHDTVEMVGNSLFALTVNCARCHSHKFDPIPQRDYYRLMALFTPAYNPDHWKPVFPWKPEIRDRALPDASTDELAQIELPLNAAVDRDVAATAAVACRSGPGMYARDLKAKLTHRIAERTAQRRHVGRIQALYDVGPAPVTHLLKRGQYEAPGAVVQAGFLSVLCDSSDDAVIRERPASDSDSGRRLAFARWLTRTRTRGRPVSSRGSSSIASGSTSLAKAWCGRRRTSALRERRRRIPNYSSGCPPIFQRPARLADQAAGAGDDAEEPRPTSRHRNPVRRSSPAKPRQGDCRCDFRILGRSIPRPSIRRTRLLWRMRTKRLEAEAIRDCVLAAAGRLDSLMTGPPILLVARPDGLVTVDASGSLAAATGCRTKHAACICCRGGRTTCRYSASLIVRRSPSIAPSGTRR